ncbi:MAG: hypothetical protein IJ039_05500, partial [Clostridia bacterium]|nr:hypothetical protein [Clostridia bacterium]
MNDLGRYCIEGNYLTENSGAEEIKLSAAKEICLGKLFAVTRIVAKYLKSSVFTGGHGSDVKVNIIR